MDKNLDKSQLAELPFKALNRRDFSILEPWVTEEITFDFPGAALIEGKRRVVLFLKAMLMKYPVLVFKVQKVIADGDSVCVIWNNEGRDSKGSPYSNRGNTIITTKNGKIVSISDYFKDTSFIQGRK